MRNVVSDLIRESMEEVNEGKRRLADIVTQFDARLTQVATDLDLRISQVTAQIGGEVQARDAQLRDHLDESARRNNKATILSCAHVRAPCRVCAFVTFAHVFAPRAF